METISTNSANFLTNSFGMEFVKIPAGSFTMGDSSNEPIHQVKITREFYLGRTLVTQAQWLAVMGTNPSKFKHSNNCPVESVSWENVQEFIHKLNSQEEGTYRLPTEAEWEYSCRAGTTGDYAGDLDSLAWYSENSGSKPHEVATKQPNAWGLYDMHGSVWEWTADWYGDYPVGIVSDPTGASSGSDRVLRGGSWNHDAVFARSGDRDYYPPSYQSYDLGFRLVRVTE